MTKYLLPILFLAFSLDLVIKPLVTQQLAQAEALSLGPLGFQLRWVENTGIAFSLLEQTPPWVLAVAAIVLMIGLTFWARTQLPKEAFLPKLATALILGGGLNNALDRLWDGAVTDYIELTWISYPIFNLSDVLVVSGCILLAYWLVFRSEQPQLESHSEAPQE